MKMTMPRVWLFIFISLITWGITDFGIVMFGGGTSSSISNAMINMGFKSPIFTGMVFACIGHLFFYMYPEEEWSVGNLKAERRRQLIAAVCGAVAYEGLRRIFVFFWKRWT